MQQNSRTASIEALMQSEKRFLLITSKYNCDQRDTYTLQILWVLNELFKSVERQFRIWHWIGVYLILLFDTKDNYQ